MGVSEVVTVRCGRLSLSFPMDTSKDTENIQKFALLMREAKNRFTASPKDKQIRGLISESTNLIYSLRRRKGIPKSKLNTCIGMARAWAGHGVIRKTQIREILTCALQTDYFD